VQPKNEKYFQQALKTLNRTQALILLGFKKDLNKFGPKARKEEPL